jgi:metal-responsive CopG/Arc/MetJ family transcriptional regulator
MPALNAVVVPQGEGPTKPVSLRFPTSIIRRLDACAAATDNSRSDVIFYLLRWALDQYESQVAAERQGR